MTIMSFFSAPPRLRVQSPVSRGGANMRSEALGADATGAAAS